MSLRPRRSRALRVEAAAAAVPLASIHIRQMSAQRDQGVSSGNAKIIALAPLASAYNPFTGLFAAALEKAGARPVEYAWGLRALARCDAVIFHWPDQFINPGARQGALGQLMRLSLLKRTHRLKIVWVAHNVMPHDSLEGPAPLRSAFINALDGIIYLSEASRGLVRAAHRLPAGIVEQVTVHGPYPVPPLIYAPPAPGERVRIASIGLVRPYKNLEELVDAAGAVPPSELEVAIVGKRHDPAYAAALEARAAAHPALRFALSDGVIGQDVLDAAIDDAHGIVLPYRRILNSGSAILALSRARPVLVPAAGSMPELARMVGSDWVRLYEGALTPDVLRDFAAHLGTIPAGAAPDLSAISWDRVTQDLRGFLGRLFRSPHDSTLEAGDADANRETVRHAQGHP